MFSSDSRRWQRNPNFKLIALDIDGTLLNEHKEITLANVQALQAFQAAGGKAVLTSGRLPRSVQWHTQLLGLDTPFAALNGAILGSGDQIIEGVAFERAAVLNFLEYCRSGGLYCHIYTSEGMVFDQPAHWNEHWSEQHLARLEGQLPPWEWRAHINEYCPAQRVEDLVKWVKSTQQPIYKMAVLSDVSLATAAEGLKKIRGLDVTSSDPRNLEICPEGVSKGLALQRLAAMLGVAMSHVVAIGDNYNDASLFDVAGLSVAMGNAPEEIQQRAKVVTKSNCESGVAWAIRHWVMGEEV